jgi:ADP-heptose:LPS heptosyltransferase
MHLAGLSNTATLSFFGTSLFASSARWASISDKSKQHNFELPLDYDEELYVKIEDTLMEIL